MKTSDITWHNRFMDIAKQVATWSKDPSTKVGAIIVDDKNRIVSTGYNGALPYIDDEFALESKENKYLFTVHAEQNAVMSAIKGKLDLSNCRIYVTNSCCKECAKMIAHSGIISTVITLKDEDGTFRERWNSGQADELFKQCDIKQFQLQIQL